IEVGLAVEYIRNTAFESVPFGEIQLQRAETVGKKEGVNDDTSGIGKGIGFHDVHTPGSKRASNLRKQERPVIGHQRQFKPVSAPLQIKLHGVVLHASRHLEMAEDLFRTITPQIPFW